MIDEAIRKKIMASQDQHLNADIPIGVGFGVTCLTVEDPKLGVVSGSMVEFTMSGTLTVLNPESKFPGIVVNVTINDQTTSVPIGRSTYTVRGGDTLNINVPINQEAQVWYFFNADL